jgi:hypothetical protein
MSFKAELEALIANANSSLEGLEAVLRRAKSQSGHGHALDASNGEAGEIQTEIDTIRQRILSSLLQIRESYTHDQERLSDLEGELKLDLENVRQCAIDYFIKGEYRECERLLGFLAKIQPHDEDLRNFLELSRRKQLENEQLTGAAADSQSRPKNGDLAQHLSHETHEQPIERTPQRDQPFLRSTEETAFQAKQSETIEPQILAEIELKTAAHIHETYRTLPSSTTSHFLVWVVVVALGIVTTFYWLSRSRLESSVPESLSSSQSKVEGLVETKDPLADLRQEAQALFDAGKLQEAGRVCDAILSKDPQDSFAVSLKEYTRAALDRPKTPAEEAVQSDQTAQLHDTATADRSPGSTSANVQLRSQPMASDAPLRPALSTSRPTLDPKPMAATVQNPGEQPLNLAKQAAPASVAPAIPAAGQVATVPQIKPDQLVELNSRIQAKDFDQARVLLGRLESGFPGNPDLRTLAERLRVEAGKQQSEAASWIEKAEAAWIAGRYVTPPDDNVVLYCNMSLKADPKNQRAMNLKKEIVQRALSQAKDWIQRGRFDAARLSFASMDYLARGDAAFPYPKPDIKRELEKLEFTTHPMVHDHKLGSCSGVLRFNSYAVSYVPSGGSSDGFTETLNSIFINAEGERLKISYRDKSFHLRSQNGNRVQAVYQQLVTRMSDEKSTLATRSQDPRKP